MATTRLTWIPGRTQIGADLTAASATLSVLAVVYLLDISHLWTFSTLVGNFLMARLSIALLLSIVLIGGVTINVAGFESATEQYTFLTVAAMVSLFSLIFASRVESQHAAMSALASRDGLTSAFNRRTMDHDLEALVRRSRGDGPTHCLAILDLDNFKALNDRFGHGLGDEVLIGLAKLVASSTREKDRFYRYGGEEFVLLLPDTPIKGAQVALGNLRQALAESLRAPDGPVTASFGLAEYRPKESVEEWLKRADQALLQAKQDGKDRIIAAD